MLIVDAVLETPNLTGFTLWPVADLPAFQLMEVSGRMTPSEVGTAMAILTANGFEREDERGPATDAVDHVRRMIEAEGVGADGGLRFRDADLDLEIRPGCCSRLYEWRDWLAVMDGGVPEWLGHDPWPTVEHAGPVVRVWQEGGEPGDTPSGRHVDIPKANLPVVLEALQNDLRGFLALAEEWAGQYCSSVQSPLITKLDEDLTITAPLWPGSR
ncbi:hypothetical protein [Embleya sp. NBC_00896]|uniref:hypothetical protein n=1 Tax=Embleya sp. NBC_00896 TaxID=2975961 RepID=UPI002F911F46|nr:hypothetical protein OG928_34975 [Embleya sp. NBC_00896]